MSTRQGRLRAVDTDRADVDLDALAAKLAPLLAPLVIAQFALALGATQPAYSTRVRREPPEYQGRSKKWKADAPSIPGAVRIGRWWSVPRDAYARWLAAQSTTTAPTPIEKAANDSAPWSPASALASLGLRAQGGGR